MADVTKKAIYFYSVRQGKANTLVSNHFHSVKSFFLFLSVRPRDFDGMLGTGLLVSMYTTKAPIDCWGSVPHCLFHSKNISRQIGFSMMLTVVNKERKHI
jgi:hypothetical protein